MLEPRIENRKICIKDLITQMSVINFNVADIEPKYTSSIFELIMLNVFIFKPFILLDSNQNYIFANCKSELSSIFNICNNNVKLTNLFFYDKYNSLKFKELPKGVQRYFNNIEIDCCVMYLCPTELLSKLENLLNTHLKGVRYAYNFKI